MSTQPAARNSIFSPGQRGSRRRSSVSPAMRTVFANDRASNERFRFSSNARRTTKYTLLTFLPKGLYEQFRRVANLYFLLIAALSLTPVSPVSPVTNIVPLVLVIAASLAKEAFEDARRAKKDRQMNARPVEVLRGDAFLPTPWRDVRVGDVVRVRDRDAFPADLVLLSSSATGRGGGGEGGGSGDSGRCGGEGSSPSADASSSPSAAGGADASSSLARSPSSSAPSFPTGVAFVETANLDGETNLKMRQALPQTVGLLSAAAICRATTGFAGGASGAGSGGGGGGGGEALASSSSSAAPAPPSAAASPPPSPRPSLLRIECEQPNSAIYRFQGVLVTPEGERLPLSPNQLLLRGCVLRNTAWCLGVVVFCGGEAKVAQNATAVPSKRSAVERRLDRLVAGVFVLLGCLAGVNAAAGAYYSLDPKMWYLALGERGEKASTRALFDVAANRALVAGTTFLTSVALYSSLIPISLYVTIEVVKYAQAAVFVSGDRRMYDARSDVPAAARTSNLNEDLGQVRWLLSDKTGTLTCNRMDFFGFSVGGEAYGDGDGGGGGGARGAPSSSSSSSSSSSASSSPSRSPSSSTLRSKFHDPRVPTADGAWLSAAPQAPAIAALMRALSLCHTVMTEESNSEEKEEEEEAGGGARSGGGSQGRGGGRKRSGTSSFLVVRAATLLRAAGRLSWRAAAGAQSAVSPAPPAAAQPPSSSSSSSPPTKRVSVTYQAASPDEVALVSGAAQLGFPLLRRTPAGVVVGEPSAADALLSSSSSSSTSPTTVERAYDVLAVLEFSSARRRQSVVVRPAGAPPGADCELICKGADAALGPLLRRQKTASSGKPSSSDDEGDALWETTLRHLEDFGGRGLRTLCVASRTVPASEFAAWEPLFAAARLRTDPGRDAAVEACCASLERGLSLLGATAVEDALQEGVGDAIEALRDAGVATWVLTGDKMETAVNVGFSCRLLRGAGQQRRVEIAPRFVPPLPSGAGAGTAEDLEEADRAMAHDIVAQLEDALAEAEMEEEEGVEEVGEGKSSSSAASSSSSSSLSSGLFTFFSKKKRRAQGAVVDANALPSSALTALPISPQQNRKLPRALVVDGAALAFLLADDARAAELLSLALRSEAVVFCRVSPLQKALVTKLLVSKGPQMSSSSKGKGNGNSGGGGGVALAIGDGANDVGMIQAAAVGVGVAGNEGMQAVMAADFALAQFRFLVDLLLVHGRWNYERVALVICYFFYKNAVYTLTQFWFNVFAAAHSGQRLYDDWHQSLFNLVFTACPVIVAGLLERDGSREGAARAASANGGKLYRRTQDGRSMGWRALALWALSALWHSAVCYAVPTLALAGGAGGEASPGLRKFLGLAGGGPHASSEGLWQTGTLGFTLVVVVVNLKLLVSSRAHTFWHVFVVALSIGAYLGYLVIYSSLSPAGAFMSRLAPAAAVYGVAGELASNPAAWIALVVGTAGCLLPDVALGSVSRRRRRQEEGEGESAGGGGAGGAAAGAVVSVAKSKSSSNVGLAKNSAVGKLKAGGVGRAEEPSSSSSASASAEISPLPFPASSSSGRPSSGRPPLHPLRSVSLQSRISELQQRQRDGANNSNNDNNNDAAASLERRSSSAAALPPPSSSSSLPSSAASSARHTGYAFDHPGFESFFSDEAEREVVRRTTSLSARVSNGGANGGAVASAAAVSDDAASVAASSAAATAGTSVSGDVPSPLPDAGASDNSTQLQVQRLSSSGRRYTATDALDLA